MTANETYMDYFGEDRRYYKYNSIIKRLYGRLCQDRNYLIYSFVKALRKDEFYFTKKSVSKLYTPLYIYWKRRKNKLGQKINLDCIENCFAPGLYIAHTDIIAGNATVGKNCKLHGQNCIGSGAVIGDDCELWVGAKVFGPAKLANNITVAAGAIVVSSFDEEGITVGGVPAKKIK